MVWRIFCFVLAISIGLLLFGIYTVYTARDALHNIPPSFTFGPDDADLAVVGFLDYSCTHCRSSYKPLMDAVRQDGKVKFTPLLISPPGGDDEYALRLTYAASMQGKYKEVFEEIMGNYRPISEKDLTDIALKLGMNEEALQEGIKAPIIEKLIGKSTVVFKKMNGQYTPTFFVGPRIKYVPTETPTTEDFLRIFKEARGEKPKIETPEAATP